MRRAESRQVPRPHRVVEQLKVRHPAGMLDQYDAQTRGSSGCSRALRDGVIIPGTPAWSSSPRRLTGGRVSAAEGKRLAAKRRNIVDQLALTAVTWWCTSARHRPDREDGRAHGRGARQEYLVLVCLGPE